MFGGLLFVVCVVLYFHYHDSIPWYIWVAAVIGLLSSFSEPALKLKRTDRWTLTDPEPSLDNYLPMRNPVAFHRFQRGAVSAV
jgi:hypothetical protein